MSFKKIVILIHLINELGRTGLEAGQVMPLTDSLTYFLPYLKPMPNNHLDGHTSDLFLRDNCPGEGLTTKIIFSFLSNNKYELLVII